MVQYVFSIYHQVQKVQVPITIFYGTNDGVIPYRCAYKLQSLLKPSDQFITIPGGTHNNLNDFPVFLQKLDSLLTV